MESAARMTVLKLDALGHEQLNFPIIAFILPVSISIYGLLGLDFLSNHILTLDFKIGEITFI